MKERTTTPTQTNPVPRQRAERRAELDAMRELREQEAAADQAKQDRRGHLRAVPDLKEPTVVGRSVDRLADASGLGSRRKVIAGVVAGVAMMGAAVGGVLWQGAQQRHDLRDRRTEINVGQENELMTAFLTSGQPEIRLGDNAVTTFPGTVTVTQTGDTPINIRETPVRQTSESSKKPDSNTGDRASLVQLVNPVVVTNKDGTVFMGGVAQDKDGKLPVSLTPEAYADNMVWLDVSRLEKVQSGAHVEKLPNGGEPFAVLYDQAGLFTMDGQTLPTMQISSAE